MHDAEFSVWYCRACFHAYIVDERGHGYIDEDGTYYTHDYYQVKMVGDERLRRRKYEEGQRRKAARISSAVVKECSECEKNTHHDKDDYICIVCRDGVEALPDPAYMPGMTTAA